jgi:hypothetical protein
MSFLSTLINLFKPHPNTGAVVVGCHIVPTKDWDNKTDLEKSCVLLSKMEPKLENEEEAMEERERWLKNYKVVQEAKEGMDQHPN